MATIQNAISVRIVSFAQPPFFDRRETLYDQEEARKVFWNPLLNSKDNSRIRPGVTDDDDETNNIEYWEEKISRELGIEIHSRLTTEYTSLGVSRKWQDEKCELLGKVAFKAVVLSYSSMELGFTVAGAENLAKAFNADFDTFRIFFEGFIHPAFADVVDPGFANKMHYEVNSSPELIAEFQRERLANQSIPTKSENDGTPSFVNQAQDKARFAWGLANTSLIVPVILALAVIFYAFQEMNNVRSQYNTALQGLLEQQTKILESVQTRLSFYDGLQDSMLRQQLNLPPNLTQKQPTAVPSSTSTQTP